MFKKIAVAAALAAVSAGAMAADHPYFYAGGDVGTTDFDRYQSETSIGGFGGYQVNEHVAVEVGYRRLARTSGPGWDAKLGQLYASAVGTLPLSGGFNVFGRLGVSRLSDDYTEAGFSDNGHRDKALFGVGFGYAFTSTVMGRVEMQKPESGVSNLSASVVFRF